jgi:YHS domain-containing protein
LPMKSKKKFLFTMFLFALFFTAAAQESKLKEKKEVQHGKKMTAKSTPLPADGKDPVCFMKVKKGTLVTTRYKEKLYGFCSEHCKAVFLVNPAAQLQ